MCKLMRFLLLSAAVLSCQKPLFDRPPRSNGAAGQGVRRDSSETQLAEPDAPPPPPALYATAFRYQDEEAADVLLLKNGEEMLQVPVSGQPEPQRHRLLDGHLWTDACDGREVVVSCDGEERFRYEGDELLRGFWVDGGTVYTLGQRQGREGLSFRINGKERFGAPTGTILGGPEDSEWEGGAFSQGSDGVCYSYGIPLWKNGQLLWEYHVMQGASLLKTLPAGNAEAIYDIRMLDGMVYRSEKRSGAVCLVKDETYRSVELSASEDPHFWKLVAVNGEMLLKGYSTALSGKRYSFWLRSPSQVPFIVTKNQPVRDLVTDGEHVAYVVENAEGLVQGVFLDQEAIPLPSGRYLLPSSRCVRLKDGVLGLALSSPDGQEHLLVRGREVTTLRFSGIFTSVQIH